ncbi:hypothetical protein, partial [Sinomicrobium weinanense]
VHAQEKTQNIEIRYGNVFKNDEREIPTDIIGHDKNGYYLLYSGGRFGQKKNKSIRKFSPDLVPAGEEIDLIPENQEGESQTLGIAQFDDKIIHVWSLTTESSKQFYYQLVNLDNFSLEESALITEIKDEESYIHQAYNSFIISPDRSRIFLLYSMPVKKGLKAKLHLKVFDTGFREINTEEYGIPVPDDQFSIQDLFFSEEGEPMILAKKFDSPRTLKEDRKKGYQYMLYRLKEGQFQQIASIPIGDKHLRILEHVFLSDGSLVLTGFYSVKNMYAISGVYFSRIDLKTGKTTTKEHSFDETFYTKLIDNDKKKARISKRLKKGKLEAPFYLMRNSFRMPGDHILLMAEQIHTFTQNFVTRFFHENLALVKLDSKGNLAWSNQIAKKNIKTNVGIYSSYYPVKRNDDLFLLYNGNTANLGHRTGHVANSFAQNGRAFIATEVKNDGTYKRQVLATREEMEGITIRPSLANWINENTLLLFGQDIDNLKNQRFLKIIFKP